MGEELRLSSLILHTSFQEDTGMSNCGVILLIYSLQREQFFKNQFYKIGIIQIKSRRFTLSLLIQSPCKSVGDNSHSHPI